jgi:hypothetical protein
MRSNIQTGYIASKKEKNENQSFGYLSQLCINVSSNLPHWVIIETQEQKVGNHGSAHQCPVLKRSSSSPWKQQMFGSNPNKRAIMYVRQLRSKDKKT